jgi:hypothetical protein
MFPQKNWLGYNKNWEDLGERNYPKEYVKGSITGEYYIKREGCDVCGDVVHIGKEKEEMFLFCPRCFRKFRINLIIPLNTRDN